MYNAIGSFFWQVVSLHVFFFSSGYLKRATIFTRKLLLKYCFYQLILKSSWAIVFLGQYEFNSVRMLLAVWNNSRTLLQLIRQAELCQEVLRISLSILYYPWSAIVFQINFFLRNGAKSRTKPLSPGKNMDQLKRRKLPFKIIIFEM